MPEKPSDKWSGPALRAAGREGEPDAPASGLPSRRAPKLSVSLYERDLARLDEIKEYLRRHGYRNPSDSEALRLACRAVEIGDHFIPLYQEMQREDRRRKR